MEMYTLKKYCFLDFQIDSKLFVKGQINKRHIKHYKINNQILSLAYSQNNSNKMMENFLMPKAVIHMSASC